jgi:DNA-binding NtrC family response regulator
MVVDDQAPARTSIAARLDLEGYAVIEASNADEAVDSIRNRRHIDAVISDVRMPGSMDGVGLASWIMNNAPNIAVLLMSARRKPATMADLPPETTFLRKPFQMPELLSALDQALRLH